jgi:hypothetical protein
LRGPPPTYGSDLTDFKSNFFNGMIRLVDLFYNSPVRFLLFFELESCCSADSSSDSVAGAK